MLESRGSELEYMYGSCHVFALAAQSLTGWPMVALLYKGRKRGEASLLNCHDVVHVYVLTPNQERFDVFGLGGDAEQYEAEREQGLGSRLVTVPCDKALIDKMVNVGWLSPYSTSELEQAVAVAKRALYDEELI